MSDNWLAFWFLLWGFSLYLLGRIHEKEMIQMSKGQDKRKEVKKPKKPKAV